MNPTFNLNIKDYTYNLPTERIAHYPTAQRPQSRLLVYENGHISDTTFSNILEHLPENNLIVFNKTKVINARFVFTKESGSKIEIFCLEPIGSHENMSAYMQQKGRIRWKCMVGGARKWKEGPLSSSCEGIILKATKELHDEDTYTILFEWENKNLNFENILDLFGNIPLPPYIKRQAEPDDKERYQTVYAKDYGSVAAPTAGLHFTDSLIDKINTGNVNHCTTAYVTLHVGAGTFKPVGDDITSHVMHTEHIIFDKETLDKITDALKTGAVTAVGTTSLRALESIYWTGVSLIEGHEDPFHVSQFLPYNTKNDIPPTVAIKALKNFMTKNNVHKLQASTALMIVPGYTFRIVQNLITNFHQPHSTLLLLVAALTGNDWKMVYDHALNHDYRFLSYGDACFFKR